MTDQERLAALKATVAELEAKIEGEKKPERPSLEAMELCVGKHCSCDVEDGGCSGLDSGVARVAAADTLRDLRVRGGKLLNDLALDRIGGLTAGVQATSLLRDLGVVPTP